MKPRVACLVSALLATACREELKRPAPVAVDPPASTVDGIPAAQVSGKLRGTVFTVRDARYVIDRRIGFEHTDIKLSAGAAESSCAPLAPARAPSVWIRIDGPAPLETRDLKVGPGVGAPYSVHYQVHDGERWVGVGDGAALLSLHAPGPDGRLSGSIAVCFPDADKSCVSGSFEAVSCPWRIDQPVRGAPAIEREPTAALKPRAPAPSASAAASTSSSTHVAPSAVPSHHD
ncbi:MAG: hypothetical protein ACHREM_09845 [Polyangiales bacterium]